ncbi:metallophosphoesterase family protein [Lapidilactobacillus luobeiensis]|uniref:metallophosphoesterase family protein n=1 Tax=Lapidilactobacillus luobeiensis TaxID=2950371 RepID=UPI0021C474EC|nr:metallophosphoesterase [Lapidilactobacillus luobeiensis]
MVTTFYDDLVAKIATRSWPSSLKKVLQQRLEENISFRESDPLRYGRNLHLLNEFISENKKVPDLTFNVIGDPHTNGNNEELPENSRFIMALKDIPFLNPISAALLVPGDFTSRGTEMEYAAFFNFLVANNTVNPIAALGNHDVRWQKDPLVYQHNYFKYNGDHMGTALEKRQLYWDTWVSDYHFIVLNTERDMKDNAYLSTAQLTWLQKKLAEKNDDQKPVFVLIHQAFKGTSDHIVLDRIYDPGQYPLDDPDRIVDHEEKLRNILYDYPNTVIFTGHVHNGRDLLKVYAMDFGHIIDLPSYIRADYGDKGCCDAYQVDVYGSEIRLRLRNFLENYWVTEKEVTFRIDSFRADPKEF